MIYLDNAASSWPKPESVVRRARAWFGENGANPGRSQHRAGMTASRAIREGRQRVAELLGVTDPRRVAFTPGATTSLNAALKGVLEPEDHVVTTVLEHNSVLRPLHQLATERNVRFTAVEPEPSGRVTPEAVVDALRPETRVVSITHASNVLGTVQPISAIARAVREARGADVFLVVDAAQTAGHLDVAPAVRAADLVAVAGHKGLFGLQGTGALYVRPGVEMRPYTTGGTGTRSDEPVHPDEMPDLLEAGTTNTPGIVTMSEGARFVSETGTDVVTRKGAHLLRRILDGLADIEGVDLHSPPIPAGADEPPSRGSDRGGGGGRPDRERDEGEDEDTAPLRVPIVLFNLGSEDPAEVAYLYDHLHAVSVRAGVHCAPWAHRWIGTLQREPQGAIRASLGFFNTEDEVDRFLAATKDLVRRLASDGSA